MLLNLDKQGNQEEPGIPREEVAKPADSEEGPVEAVQAPGFATVQKRPWIYNNLVQALLIILSLVVAVGLVLILLPQPTVDRIAGSIEERSGAARQEKIAFLYVGEQVTGNEFRLRGAVRNITSEPVEKLDAAIRFYSHDGTMLETAIVRMDKETIAPDEVAHFEVVYPDYKMQFASYSVEFKLRQGGIVHYKDMRTNR